MLTDLVAKHEGILTQPMVVRAIEFAAEGVSRRRQRTAQTCHLLLSFFRLRVQLAAGTDISHWFDMRTGDVKTCVDEITGIVPPLPSPLPCSARVARWPRLGAGRAGSAAGC